MAPTYVIYGHCVTMQWHNPWYAEEGKKLLFCVSVCVGTPEEFLDRVGFVTLCNVLIYFVCVCVYALLLLFGGGTDFVGRYFRTIFVYWEKKMFKTTFFPEQGTDKIILRLF